MRKIKTGLAVLLAAAAFTVAQIAAAADVTGTWIMAVETGAGSAEIFRFPPTTRRSARNSCSAEAPLCEAVLIFAVCPNTQGHSYSAVPAKCDPKQVENP